MCKGKETLFMTQIYSAVESQHSGTIPSMDRSGGNSCHFLLYVMAGSFLGGFGDSEGKSLID